MATTISKLAILLSLNSQGVTSGVADASKKLDQFDKKVGGLGSKAFGMLETKAVGALSGIGASFMATVGSAVALERVIGGIADAFERVSTQSRRASQLGSNVNELGALEFAFGQGTQVDANGTFDALRAFNKRISDAKDPANELARALDRIGLSARQLEGLTLTDRVRTIGEAIRQLPAAEDRAAVAAKFFEETGSNIVALFNEGDAAFLSFIADYEQLYGKLNPEEVEAMRQSTQAMSRLWVSIEGSFARLATELGPAVVGTLDRLTTISIAMREATKEESNTGQFVKGWMSTTKYIDPFQMLYAQFMQLQPTSAPGGALGGDLDVGPANAMANAEKSAKALEESQEKAAKAADDLARKEEAVHEALMRRGDALRVSLLTPFEEAMVALAEIDELAAAGAIGYSTRGRAMQSAFETAKAELLKDAKVSLKPFVDPSAGLVERGSAAAFSAERQATNTLKEMLEQQKAAAEHAAEEVRLLERLESAFKDAGITVRNNSL